MKKNKFLFAFVVLVYMFLFAPLAIIAVTAFGGESYVTFPIQSFSLKWFVNVFTTDTFMQTFRISRNIYISNINCISNRSTCSIWIKQMHI